MEKLTLPKFKLGAVVRHRKRNLTGVVMGQVCYRTLSAAYTVVSNGETISAWEEELDYPSHSLGAGPSFQVGEFAYLGVARVRVVGVEFRDGTWYYMVSAGGGMHPWVKEGELRSRAEEEVLSL